MDDAKDDGALLMETSGRDLKDDIDLESSRDVELKLLGPLKVAFSLFPVHVVLMALASEILLFLLLFTATLTCSAAF